MGEDGEEHGEEVEGEDEEDQTEEEPEGEGEGEEEHTEEQVEGNAVLLVGVVAGAAVVTHAGGEPELSPRRKKKSGLKSYAARDATRP
eukprot:jgi/Bigna1/147489/aug1.173_g22197